MQKVDEVTWCRLFKMRRCVECGSGLIHRWRFANGIVQYKCEAEECGYRRNFHTEESIGKASQ